MKRTVTAFLCACLVWVFCPVAFAANVTVAVKSETKVSGPWVTLGDIAVISGDSLDRVKLLKDLKLGDAPEPGATVFMTPESLEPKLIETHADFSAITWSVPPQFKITTSSQPVSGQKIAELARFFLTQTALGSTVSMIDSPADVQAPVGKLELVPELYGVLRYNGPTTVNIAIRTDGRSFIKVPVQFEVRRYLDVLVAAANLNAGDILSEQSVRLERMDAGKIPAGYLTEINKAVGLQARYAIVPGSIISERSLVRPILIQRGEIVRIVARIGDIEIYANGISFSQGASGDLVRVQNTTTKRFLNGRVQDDKSVLVLNQPGG
ncbi:MAG TPA: flagellar basal body P-ring formation chaperone FlgA [Negativicutes bacterium]|nr:flagellar basal body P-ring formation chaperone FlgA [Negativicutes bacterium]